MPRGLSRPPLPQHLTANKDRSLSGILSGIGAEVIKNTVFTAYKSSVFKHVVPGAGVEPAPLESDKILSLACLPISPPGQLRWILGGA